MKKQFAKVVLLLIALGLCAPTESEGQCPMCKVSVESNLKAGGSAGKGLNTGILYMLALPYLLVGTIGYLWWKNKKRDVDEVFK